MNMFKGTVLCIPRSDAVRVAATILSELGICITRKCEPDVTHVLLPVPSFPNGDEYLAHYLTELPDDVIISGGNLTSPLLEQYITVDFLQDPWYLAENAAITADCALQIIEREIPATDGCKVLVLGWGRIGKCISRLLQRKGFDVTVAARNHQDLAMLKALGYSFVATSDADSEISRYNLIVNTVPELILPNAGAKTEGLILELASKPGITGGNIITARGLPGKMAPERSGKLIAETFIRLSI